MYIHGALLAENNGCTIGGIAGYCLPATTTHDLFFNVMFCYVRREFRHLSILFIKEFEKVLATTKTTKITFGFLAGENQDKKIRLFKILGYTPLEIHMVKNI